MSILNRYRSINISSLISVADTQRKNHMSVYKYRYINIISHVATSTQDRALASSAAQRFAVEAVHWGTVAAPPTRRRCDETFHSFDVNYRVLRGVTRLRVPPWSSQLRPTWLCTLEVSRLINNRYINNKRTYIYRDIDVRAGFRSEERR